MAEVMSNGKIQRDYKCARECFSLMRQVRQMATEDVSSCPGDGECLSLALKEIDRFEKPVDALPRKIDFQELYKMRASRFGVEKSFLPGQRYQLTLDALPEFFQKFDCFTINLRIDFPGVKTVYANLSCRLLMRALIAIHGGFCPFKKCDPRDTL